MKGFVYMITSPSNKIYIGSTLDIERRWSFYIGLYCKAQTKLYNSLKRYDPKKEKEIEYELID